MNSEDIEKLIAEQLRQQSRLMIENALRFGTVDPRVIRRQGVQQRWDIPIGDEMRIDDKQTLIIPRK